MSFDNNRSFEPQKMHKGLHDKIDCLSSAVDMVKSPLKGRMMVAKEDIPAGALLIDEEGYMAVSTETMGKERCLHCCRRLPVDALPCAQCTRVRFCGEQCRTAAGAYHRWECPFPVHSVRDVGRTPPTMTEQVVRTMLATSVGDMLANDPQEETTRERTGTYGCREGDEYGVNFTSVMAFVSHSTGFNSLKKKEWHGICELLEERKYFDQSAWPDELSLTARKALFTRVASALYGKLQCNTSGVCTFEYDSETEMRRNTECLPAAVHVVNNAVNHSCAPNCIKTFVGRRNYTRAQRFIKRGEELTVTYGPRFGVQRRAERKASLRAGYGFDCDCRPCTGESYERLERLAFDAYRCVKCGHAAWSTSTGGVECGKCARTQPYSVAQIDAAMTQSMTVVRQFGAAPLTDDALLAVKTLLAKSRIVLHKNNVRLVRIMFTVAHVLLLDNVKNRRNFARFALELCACVLANDKVFFGVESGECEDGLGRLLVAHLRVGADVREMETLLGEMRKLQRRLYGEEDAWRSTVMRFGRRDAVRLAKLMDTID